jgi:sterol desaturase/sphingolipid hydroxylase (fatty acid hydroxylase superfamily)
MPRSDVQTAVATVAGTVVAHVAIAGTGFMSCDALVGAAALNVLYGCIAAVVYSGLQPRFPQLQNGDCGSKEIEPHRYFLYTSNASLASVLQKAWLISWLNSEATRTVWTAPLCFSTSLGAFACFLLVYDALYYGFHRFILHTPFGWKHMHRFHHQVKAPRSMLDAVYVHPVEAFTAIWLLYLPPVVTIGWLGLPVHISAIMLLEASIALMVVYHSGMRVEWPRSLRCLCSELPLSPIFSIAAHDLHHSETRCNFGLFTRVFDVAFGTSCIKRR